MRPSLAEQTLPFQSQFRYPGTEQFVPKLPEATMPHPRRWLAFAAVITASVMDLLDSTIAQVGAPSIRRDLGGSYAVIEWLTASYALAMAVALLTGGRRGDRHRPTRGPARGVGAV